MKNNSKHNNNKLPENTNPFSVPEGYFDSFAEQMLSKVNQPETEKNFHVKNIFLLKPTLALIASFVAVFLIVIFAVKFDNTKQAQSTNEEKNQQLEYMNYYYINDHVLITTFEDVIDTDYNEDLLETVLLASVSDIELMNFQN